ncbi:MAG: EF-hand domain-containing protein, partial [Planctomycetes bacterium]|nr:EF-hand domain-containing protein [Planctomycetota bacterium]
RALRSGDADGDGVLNAAEFAKAFSSGRASDRERASRSPRRPGSSPGGRPAPYAADFIRRLDKDGDGKVSSEELPQTYRARLGGKFEEFDKNKDGALNQQEVAAMLPTANSSRRPSGTPSRDSDRPRPSSRDAAQPSQDALFAILDRDRDGKLSRRELEAAGSILARLDRDKDGSVSKREIAAAASDKAPSSRSSRERDSRGGISSYAKRLDKNNDGKITREEASGPIKERFDRLDEDGDGILKVEDVEKAFKRSRSRSPKDSKDSDSRESDRRKRSPKARKDSDSPEGGGKARRPSRQRES